ncbi:MAG: cytidine deaminase [Selenomonadales bacterium]|nr:cytidine deaminase [Selenomonadales bacterium]
MKHLMELARQARANAYIPYSHFAVGAALLAKSGRIYTGANVENASYGLTICAERTAIVKAVSEGEREFEAIAIVADTDKPVLPCGACLQVMAEFHIDRIILGNLTEMKEVKLSDLLPHNFTL